MNIGERLRMLREERNMTLDAVAAAVGVGRPTIYKYETGAIKTIPPDKVHMLANLFGVTRPYLMGWTEERKANPQENLYKVALEMQKQKTEASASYWKTGLASASDRFTAATQACRALIKFGISRTPIYAHQILQQSLYATMISFSDDSELDEIERIGDLTTYRRIDGMVMSSVRSDSQQSYLFAVNRDVPMGKLRLALAVELGHIYLGHVGYRREDISRQEAECFATHLEFPRPLIRLLAERGFVFTEESFQRIFGDCEWCLDSILHAEPVTVSPELNRLLKEQFTPYVNSLDAMGVLKIPARSGETVLNFDRYMAGYEE